MDYYALIDLFLVMMNYLHKNYYYGITLDNTTYKIRRLRGIPSEGIVIQTETYRMILYFAADTLFCRSYMNSETMKEYCGFSKYDGHIDAEGNPSNPNPIFVHILQALYVLPYCCEISRN